MAEEIDNLYGGIASQLSFFQKLKLIILNPKKFFDTVKLDEGLGKPIKYFLILSIFIFIIQTTTQSILNATANTGLGLFSAIITAIMGIFVFPIFLGLVLLGSFVMSGIYHLIGKAFKINNSFAETYKALLYGSTPYLIIQAFSNLPFYDKILVLNITLGGVELNIFSVWAFILIAVGLSKLQEIEFKKAAMITVMPIIIGIIITVAILGVY